MPGCSTSAARDRRRWAASARRWPCCISSFLPGFLLVPLGILGAAVFGAAWAAIPGYLQAKRGSHIVITTIMFNLLASVLIVYLLVNVMREAAVHEAGDAANFRARPHIPFMHEMLGAFGHQDPAPRSSTCRFVLALAAAFAVWLLIYRSRLGYAIRVVGANPTRGDLCRHLARPHHDHRDG